MTAHLAAMRRDRQTEERIIPALKKYKVRAMIVRTQGKQTASNGKELIAGLYDKRTPILSSWFGKYGRRSFNVRFRRS
jgi:hypothetical protein